MTSSLQDQTANNSTVKAHPICPKCKKKMDSRVSRGKLVKTFFFWLPLKRYKCNSCNQKHYLLSK